MTDPVEPSAAAAQRLGRLHPHNVVIDCADHDVVVPFWAAALGWTVQPINDQFVGLRAPAEEAAGFDILFQEVPELKIGKNPPTSISTPRTWRRRWPGSSSSAGRGSRSTAWARSAGRSSPTPKATSCA